MSRAVLVVALALTLGAAATDWAAKEVQMGSPDSLGATKLGSTKTSASGEGEHKGRERTKNGTYVGPVWTRRWGHSVAAAR